MQMSYHWGISIHAQTMRNYYLSSSILSFASVYAVVMALLFPAHVLGVQWDRGVMTPIPNDVGIFGAQIPILQEHYWLDDVLNIRNISREVESNKADSSPRLILHWGPPLAGASSNMLYGMVWPLSYTRSQRVQWIPLPVIGTVPVWSGPTAATSTSSRFFSGHLFMTPDSYASLWTLHVPSATWRPLGPSRMPDYYLCSAVMTYNVSWNTASAPKRSYTLLPVGSVDDCWFSDISMPQVDEFGCPWPGPRTGQTMDIVNDSIIVMNGDLSSSDPSGDIWRLRLDSGLFEHYERQAKSRNGQYVYNDDQMKYLVNPLDPSVNQTRLCPVQWELLTVGGHSSRLRNTPAEASWPPSRRESATTVINDSAILVSGGVGIVPTTSTRVVLGDIWLLYIDPAVRWVRVSDYISPPTYDAGLNAFLSRRAHIFGIMTVQLPDYLPSGTSTSFQLPVELASCINSTSPVLFISMGQNNIVTSKTSFTDSAWLLVPPCQVIQRIETATSFPCSSNCSTSRRKVSTDWSVHFADGFETGSNWTAVPIPLTTGTSSYAGPLLYAQYAFLPHEQQLLGLGATMLGQSSISGVPAPPRVYDYRTRMRYDAQSDFAPSQEVAKIDQDRPMLMYNSYTDLLDGWMYIFGGLSVFDYEAANEMWRFNVETYEWQLMGRRVFDPNASQETWQTPTVSASGAFWPRWSFSPSIWSETREGSPKYIYRWGGSEYLWPQEFLTLQYTVYGFSVCQSGFYRYDLHSNLWENITDVVRSTTRWNQSESAAAAAGGYVRDGFIYPRTRCIAAPIVLGDEVYLYGGNGFPYEITGGTTKWSNDLWKLNLTSLEWTLLWPGNLSISNPANAVLSPNMQPVVSTVPYLNFPLPDGSGFGQCYMGSRSTALGYRPIVCQSYTVNTNTWLWHLSMPGAPTGITLDIGFPLSDGRVLVVLDDQTVNMNLFAILDPRTWTWTTLQPVGPTFPQGTWQWRTGPSMVYIPDQNRCYLWGGLARAADNSLIADSAVHSLDLDDEVYVGQDVGVYGMTASDGSAASSPIVAHDWLAGLSLKPLSFRSGRQIGARHFATIAGALVRYQIYLSSSSCVITVLDRVDDLTLQSRRTAMYAILSVPITANVTVRGVDITATSNSSNRVLECSSSAHARDLYCFFNFTGSRIISHSHVLQNLLLRHFSSSSDGGAVLVVSSNLTLWNVSIESSVSPASGGAMYAADSNVRWEGGRVSNASAQLSGGAIYAVNSMLAIRKMEFNRNSVNVSASTQIFAHTHAVYGFGGAIAAIATLLELTHVTLWNNSARVGGALAISGVSTLFPNTDTSFGLRTSALWIDSSRFYSNNASELGGGLFLNFIYSAVSTATNDLLLPNVKQTLFDSNNAGTRGGAIFVEDSLLVVNDTDFRRNEAGDGGGAIFWQPAASDSDWKSNQPILIRRGTIMRGVIDFGSISNSTNSACVSRVFTFAAASDTSVVKHRVSDSACNIASYGPSIGTASANLVLTEESRNVGSIVQTSGAVVTPAVRLQILDAYDQLVTTENSLYVSAFPVSLFAGESTVRAIRGEVVFENLILKAPPNRTSLVSFTPGSTLARYESDMAVGIDQTILSLTTSRLLYVGLQSVSNSSSFTHVATCAVLCSFDVPVDDRAEDAVSILITLAFNVSVFAASSLNVLTVFYGASLSTGQSFYGSDIAAASSAAAAAASASTTSTKYVPTMSENLIRSSSAVVSSVTYQLLLPSTHVRITLETADDQIGYVSGGYTFRNTCPDMYALDDTSRLCMETRSPSSGAQLAIVVVSVVAELLVLVTLLVVIVYRDEAPIRATNVGFNLIVLILLTLLPIAGIVFAVQPADSSNSICYARCWLGSLPVIGVLSVLFAKAARVAAALGSQSLKSAPVRVVEVRMWSFVVVVILLQVSLCLVFTLLPISRSELRAQILGSDNSNSQQYLIRQCSLDEDTFPSWFGAQLALLGLLALGASYVSFLCRDANSIYNESFHNSNALFMLVLTAMIVIPLAFLVRDSPDPILLLQGGAAAFITIVWCAALFAPKLMQVYRARVKKERRMEQHKIDALHAVALPEINQIGAADGLAPLNQNADSPVAVSRIVRFHAGADTPAGASPAAHAEDSSLDQNDFDAVIVSLSPHLHTYISNPSIAEQQMITEAAGSMFDKALIDSSGNNANSRSEIGGTGGADPPKDSHVSTDLEHGSDSTPLPLSTAEESAASVLPSALILDAPMSNDFPTSQHPASHFAHPMVAIPPLTFIPSNNREAAISYRVEERALLTTVSSKGSTTQISSPSVSTSVLTTPARADTILPASASAPGSSLSPSSAAPSPSPSRSSAPSFPAATATVFDHDDEAVTVLPGWLNSTSHINENK